MAAQRIRDEEQLRLDAECPDGRDPLHRVVPGGLQRGQPTRVLSRRGRVLGGGWLAAALIGWPSSFRMYYGLEFVSATLHEWAHRHHVVLDFIDPGKPAQNAFIERFNGTFRDECLNESWFVSPADAQRTIEAWRIDYDCERPRRRLKDLTPREFARELADVADCTTLTPGPA